MSTALPSAKVEQAIDRLQPDIRRLARRWFHKTFNGQPFYRHGSDQFAKKEPAIAVTPEQRAFMYELKQDGCSYREIEEILHLCPASGMDAYRCVKQHESLLVEGKAPKIFKRRKPRLSANVLKQMVATFKPKSEKEKTEYRQIIQIVETNAKKVGESLAV